MQGFLFNRRWLGLLAFVVLFGAVCFRLGLWQYHRLENRLERNEIITSNFREAPVPIEQAVPTGGSIADDDEWTRVTLRGIYDEGSAASVKFVTRDAAPGVDVVVPLLLDDGSAVLVDRGWMQTENNPRRPDLPAPPSGEVTVEGWIRQDSNAGGDAVRVNDGQVRAIDSAAFGESLPYDLRPGYVDAQSETPSATSSPALEVEPQPELGQGPHFFYALQWWFFGMLGVVGYIWFAVQERRDRRRAQAEAEQPQARATSSA